MIRVSRSGKDIYLQIAELEVMSGGENVARNGKATQSTTGYGGLPGYAIEPLPMDHPIFHTFYDIPRVRQVPNLGLARNVAAGIRDRIAKTA